MTSAAVAQAASLASARSAVAALEPRVSAGEPWALAADAGHGPESSWGPREVLAHLAEMLPYWLGEYERLVEADRPRGDGVPFGRLATDPVRIGILERDRTVPLPELFARIDLWLERWERRLAAAQADEEAAVGLHPSRGEVTAGALVDRMVVAHLEEHLEQLEDILAAG
jgi:hypothetical protein